jgi:hypothetical protein
MCGVTCKVRSKEICRRHCTFTRIGLALNIFSVISSIITIAYFSDQLQKTHEYDYIYAYSPAVCVPMSGYASNISCSNRLRWIAIFTLLDGSNMVDNPFASRSSRLTAIDDRNRLPFNASYDCMCRSLSQPSCEKNNTIINECSVWPWCILDSGMVRYLQRDGLRYYNTYISFIVASLVSIALSVIALPISIRAIRHEHKSDYIQI